MTHKYVDLGENGKKVYLYDEDENPVRQVLWGDWLTVDENAGQSPLGPEWLTVIWAPNSPTKRRKVYIKEEHATEHRPLEIIFLDVGQGDGAVLISPEIGQDERIVVIDAGEGDNMHRFLNGRFRAYRGFDFDAAIITHPDKDHYLGFESIFADHNIGFQTIYQSGLVERPVSGKFEKLGGLTEDADTGIKYMEDLAETTEDIEREFGDPDTFGRKQFPPVMHHALTNPKVHDFKMLSTHHADLHAGRAYMPDFGPESGRAYAIEVLGPVVEYNSNGKPRLRRISSNYGKTKNGHSILLRLHYGKFKVFFGGDLNIPAEKYLLQQYTGRDTFPRKGSDESAQMIREAKAWFGAEVMKCCHHGSEKVTDEFMQAVHPACFVISSGDEEGHVHPRPDLLGRLGRVGRGESPVLLSTELQRSTREKEDKDVVQQLYSDINALSMAPTPELRKAIRKGIEALSRNNVAVYGAIYLKTDGERLITAFKIEEESDLKKWFYFEYTINEDGELELG